MAAAAVALLVLHSVDGLEIIVNPSMIVALHETKPPESKDRDLTKEVRCAISLDDGKYANVVETCERVREMIEQLK